MTAVRRVLLAALLLACGFAAGVVLLGRLRVDDQASAQAAPARPPVAPPPATPATIPPTAAALPDFSRVAERTIPAVVNVSSQQVVRRALSPYEAFLYGANGVNSLESSLGSGVIVSPEGYVLTNNHVVTGDGRASVRDIVELTVTLSDDQKLPAEVVAVDEGTDLALLKVDSKNKSLPVIAWGDSDKLKVAEWVLAIGNPYQLSESVSLGIVSALNRRDYSINQFGTFIQTDAAINPGNSGGALINAKGELVGINTAIFTQSGGYQGIGFAVASNLAHQVMDDLRKYGQVPRGTLIGMQMMELKDLNPRIARRLNIDETTKGVVISQIGRGSSTDRAGFQPGDVIVSFNGTAVSEPGALARLIADAKIGSTATLGILRIGRRMELKIPIEKVPLDQTAPRQPR